MVALCATSPSSFRHGITSSLFKRSDGNMLVISDNDRGRAVTLAHEGGHQPQGAVQLHTIPLAAGIPPSHEVDPREQQFAQPVAAAITTGKACSAPVAFKTKPKPRRMRSEINRSYVCTLCSLRYASPSALRVHTSLKHPGHKARITLKSQEVCKVPGCGCMYASWSALRAHMKKKHPELFDKDKCQVTSWKIEATDQKFAADVNNSSQLSASSRTSTDSGSGGNENQDDSKARSSGSLQYCRGNITYGNGPGMLGHNIRGQTEMVSGSDQTPRYLMTTNASECTVKPPRNGMGDNHCQRQNLTTPSTPTARMTGPRMTIATMPRRASWSGDGAAGKTPPAMWQNIQSTDQGHHALTATTMSPKAKANPNVAQKANRQQHQHSLRRSSSETVLSRVSQGEALGAISANRGALSSSKLGTGRCGSHPAVHLNSSKLKGHGQDDLGTDNNNAHHGTEANGHNTLEEQNQEAGPSQVAEILQSMGHISVGISGSGGGKICTSSNNRLHVSRPTSLSLQGLNAYPPIAPMSSPVSQDYLPTTSTSSNENHQGISSNRTREGEPYQHASPTQLHAGQVYPGYLVYSTESVPRQQQQQEQYQQYHHQQQQQQQQQDQYRQHHHHQQQQQQQQQQYQQQHHHQQQPQQQQYQQQQPQHAGEVIMSQLKQPIHLQSHVPAHSFVHSPVSEVRSTHNPQTHSQSKKKLEMHHVNGHRGREAPVTPHGYSFVVHSPPPSATEQSHQPLQTEQSDSAKQAQLQSGSTNGARALYVASRCNTAPMVIQSNGTGTPPNFKGSSAPTYYGNGNHSGNLPAGVNHGIHFHALRESMRMIHQLRTGCV